MNKIKYHFSMILRGLTTLMKREKRLVLYHFLIEAISPLTPYLNIYMSAKIIDELAGDKDINTLILYVIITVVGNMILSLVMSGLNRLREYHDGLFYKNIDMYLSEKTMTMDYEDIESRETNLLYERIRSESQYGHNWYYLYSRLGYIIKNMVNITLAIALTFSLFTNESVSLFSKLLMLVLTALVVVTNCLSEQKSSKISMDKHNQLAPHTSLWSFYDRYYRDYNAGKDTRLYAMEEFLAEERKKLDKHYRDILVGTAKKTLKYFLFTTISKDVLRISTYIFVILACAAGSVSVGSITKYVSCIIIVIGSIDGIVYYAHTVINNNNYLDRFFKFHDIPSKMYKGTLPVEKCNDNEYEFEFHNVSFKYPGSERYVLKNLSMKLYIGQRLAIVGMNGSGKTTMIKLLCRLYDPIEGEITLNGIDIKKYDYDEYMSIFSVVFQDFKLFSFTIGQNVATSVSYDAEKAAQCLNTAGFSSTLSDMPKGLDTPLYKDFEEDGVEISGGEAQKIALARALYKDAPFIVLDEPTAALDPIAEFEIYSKFNEIVGDKTAIYISHRLSSCRFCDDIAVFHEGELIQRGGHGELIADENGKYYELWNAQAQYYGATRETAD